MALGFEQEVKEAVNMKMEEKKPTSESRRGTKGPSFYILQCIIADWTKTANAEAGSEN